jgi:hypothetical protein
VALELAAHASIARARLVSALTKIDTPAQRTWIKRLLAGEATELVVSATVGDATNAAGGAGAPGGRSEEGGPDGGLLFDLEGFAAAAAGIAHDVPVIPLRLVTDSIAALSPGGLVHDERPRRPSLLAALDAAAPRIVGLGRALADRG